MERSKLVHGFSKKYKRAKRKMKKSGCAPDSNTGDQEQSCSDEEGDTVQQVETSANIHQDNELPAVEIDEPVQKRS